MRAAMTILLLTLFAASSIADEERYKIVVHPSNSASAVSRDFLRDAFLKRETEWNGDTIRPVDLSTKYAVRDRFTVEVIRKTPSQLKSYWNQQIFSGKGVPPPEADSPADVVQYVLANPGAVGYIPLDADPGKAKVIGIK